MRARSTASTAWLERPLSGGWCAVGWVASSALFVTIVQLLGGPASGDADVTNVSTWPIAHARFSCSFPKNRIVVAPLYPVISGALSAAARIGHGVPFPPRPTLGTDCLNAYSAYTEWAWKAGALMDTLRVGYVGWLALLAGVVALLRASGRGRCGWEPATLLLLACLPPVWMCLENFFHPQDLLAMGLVLAAVACVRRDSWMAAGVLVVFATLSQQFALLVAAPLFILAPQRRRWSYAGAAVGTLAVAVVVLYVVASRTAVVAALLGSSNSALSSTVVSTLHLPDGLRLYVSRVIPVLIGIAVAWWATNRLGSAVLKPLPLLSVVALSLSVRLVFEVNMWGYYYMALAVTLVLLDVVAGRLRVGLVAWLLAVSVVYLVGPHTAQSAWSDVTWGAEANRILAPAVAALAVVFGATATIRRHCRRALVWLMLAAAALVAWPPTSNHLSRHVSGPWWQVVLVGLGIALAAKPLIGEVRNSSGPLGGQGAPPPVPAALP